MKPWLDRLRDIASSILPWGILGLMGASALGSGVSESVQKLVQQNGAVLLLVALLLQYLPRWLEVQMQQAAALSKLATAVTELPKREDLKFEQVLIGVQYVADQVKRLPCAGPHPGCPKEDAHVG